MSISVVRTIHPTLTGEAKVLQLSSVDSADKRRPQHVNGRATSTPQTSATAQPVHSGGSTQIAVQARKINKAPDEVNNARVTAYGPVLLAQAFAPSEINPLVSAGKLLLGLAGVAAQTANQAWQEISPGFQKAITDFLTHLKSQGPQSRALANSIEQLSNSDKLLYFKNYQSLAQAHTGWDETRIAQQALQRTLGTSANTQAPGNTNRIDTSGRTQAQNSLNTLVGQFTDPNAHPAPSASAFATQWGQIEQWTQQARMAAVVDSPFYYLASGGKVLELSADKSQALLQIQLVDARLGHLRQSYVIARNSSASPGEQAQAFEVINTQITQFKNQLTERGYTLTEQQRARLDSLEKGVLAPQTLQTPTGQDPQPPQQHQNPDPEEPPKLPPLTTSTRPETPVEKRSIEEQQEESIRELQELKKEADRALIAYQRQVRLRPLTTQEEEAAILDASGGDPAVAAMVRQRLGQFAVGSTTGSEAYEMSVALYQQAAKDGDKWLKEQGIDLHAQPLPTTQQIAQVLQQALVPTPQAPGLGAAVWTALDAAGRSEEVRRYLQAQLETPPEPTDTSAGKSALQQQELIDTLTQTLGGDDPALVAQLAKTLAPLDLEALQLLASSQGRLWGPKIVEQARKELGQNQLDQVTEADSRPAVIESRSDYRITAGLTPPSSRAEVERRIANGESLVIFQAPPDFSWQMVPIVSIKISQNELGKQQHLLSVSLSGFDPTAGRVIGYTELNTPLFSGEVPHDIMHHWATGAMIGLNVDGGEPISGLIGEFINTGLNGALNQWSSEHGLRIPMGLNQLFADANAGSLLDQSTNLPLPFAKKDYEFSADLATEYLIVQRIYRYYLDFLKSNPDLAQQLVDHRVTAARYLSGSQKLYRMDPHTTPLDAPNITFTPDQTYRLLSAQREALHHARQELGDIPELDHAISVLNQVLD